MFIVSLDPGGAADAAALSVIESKFADMTDIHLVIVRHIEELRGLTQTQAADGLATVVNDLVRKVPGQVVTTIDARGLGNTTAELAAYAGLAPIAIMPTSGEPAASFKAFATGQGLQISVGNAQILAAFRRHTSTGTFSVAEDVELADTFLACFFPEISKYGCKLFCNSLGQVGRQPRAETDPLDFRFLFTFRQAFVSFPFTLHHLKDLIK